MPCSNVLSVSIVGSTGATRIDAQVRSGRKEEELLNAFDSLHLVAYWHVVFAQLSHHMGDSTCLSRDDDRTEASCTFVLGDVLSVTCFRSRSGSGFGHPAG